MINIILKFVKRISKFFKKEEPSWISGSYGKLSSTNLVYTGMGMSTRSLYGTTNTGIHPVYQSTYTRKVKSSNLYGVYGTAKNGSSSSNYGFKIQCSGHMGMGATSPNFKFHVFGYSAYEDILNKTKSNIKKSIREDRLGYILGDE
ncbi:MAG: hypothetical protein SLAVMIC_00308 [uncultured marine phage]|uniref:Uncharacterized protein n=1 Tax=uncultured marine phage TaxID=707152 RepID=A0A8D9C8Q1_9VIRU|nr:MAG: hypothetical protein SLAVMIC_00308 [uncultured marine phage]